MKSIICDRLQGVIKANPSKSHFIRLLLVAWLYGIELEVSNPCLADDCKALLDILKKLNCKIHIEGNTLFFKPSENYSNNIEINCRESATILRMLAGISAMTGIKVKLTGEGTLLRRDFSDVVENLEKLNVVVSSDGNRLPISIESMINFNEMEVDASQSSQFLSGLLIALAKSEYQEIKVKNLVSKSYIDLTLDVLKQFGIEIENFNYEKFIFKEANLPKSLSIDCEGDWSGASYWLVAGTIKGEIELKGLNLESSQGDKIILEILKNCGANLNISDNRIFVNQGNLKPFEFDATDYPDLIPVVIPFALNCEGKSMIYGVERLINKESNRLEALINEYEKMGANIEAKDNKLCVEKSQLNEAEVSSHNDHRIAMSLVVSSLMTGKIHIDNVECIDKSYPKFLKDFELLGGRIYE